MDRKSQISSPASTLRIALSILVLVICFTSSEMTPRGNKVIYPDIPPMFPVLEQRETHTQDKIIEYKNMSDYLPATLGDDDEIKRNRQGDFHNNSFACNEEPPVCDFTVRIVDAFLAYDYPGTGALQVADVLFVVKNTRGVCQLDPFPSNLTQYQQKIPFPITVDIQCHSPELRVVFQPSRNVTNVTAFAILSVVNCTMYWKDLSTFGLHINFLIFTSFGLRDEFANGQPEYYHDCIQNRTDVLHAPNGNKGMLPNKIYSPIPGLQNIVSISANGIPRAVDDAFTKHMWPNLGSFAG